MEIEVEFLRFDLIVNLRRRKFIDDQTKLVAVTKHSDEINPTTTIKEDTEYYDLLKEYLDLSVSSDTRKVVTHDIYHDQKTFSCQKREKSITSQVFKK